MLTNTETGMFVQVTFYRNNASISEKTDVKTGRKNRTKKPDAKTGRKNRTQKPDVNGKTVESQNKILAFVLEQGEITVSQAMELLSLGKSRTSEILRNMVHDERLIKQGIGKTTCYIRTVAL